MLKCSPFEPALVPIKEMEQVRHVSVADFRQVTQQIEEFLKNNEPLIETHTLCYYPSHQEFDGVVMYSRQTVALVPTEMVRAGNTPAETEAVSRHLFTVVRSRIGKYTGLTAQWGAIGKYDSVSLPLYVTDVIQPDAP